MAQGLVFMALWRASTFQGGPPWLRENCNGSMVIQKTKVNLSGQWQDLVILQVSRVSFLTASLGDPPGLQGEPS